MVAHCKALGRSGVSCAKTAEPIKMLFGVWTRVSSSSMKQVLDGGHIDATWRIRFNRPCAAAMRPLSHYFVLEVRFCCC